MQKFKKLFVTKDVDIAFLTPLCSGIALTLTVIIGLVLNNKAIAFYGGVGSFSTLYYFNRTIKYNFKTFFFQTIGMVIAFMLGVFSSTVIWTIPFVIAFVGFFTYFIVTIFSLPHGKSFFVILACSIGMTFPSGGSAYIDATMFALGIWIAFFIGFFSSLFLKREGYIKPQVKFNFHQIIKEKFKNKEVNLVHLLQITITFFIAGIFAALLIDYKGTWIIVSCTAIIQGDDLSLVQTRYVQRILGGFLGLLFVFIVEMIAPSLIVILLLIAVSNVFMHYYLPRNYLLANLFISTLVLLLQATIRDEYSEELIIYRFISILIGGGIAFISHYIFTYLLDKLENQKQLIL